jgi:hypothetical protein
MEQIRWERYPLLAKNSRSFVWLKIQVNRVLSVASPYLSHALSVGFFRRYARSPKGHQRTVTNLILTGDRSRPTLLFCRMSRWSDKKTKRKTEPEP